MRPNSTLTAYAIEIIIETGPNSITEQTLAAKANVKPVALPESLITEVTYEACRRVTDELEHPEQARLKAFEWLSSNVVNN